MILKAKAVLAGLATYLPGYRVIRRTGGTDSARYCYSVWLRHLVLANSSGSWTGGVPKVVAELGPGDSVGIGVAALLSGSDRYYAFDLVRYFDLSRTRQIFDELVELFEQRAPIPDERELPAVNPRLSSYEFPHGLLGEASLREALCPRRIAAIKSAIEHAGDAPTMIRYQAPWADPEAIPDGTVDLIFSQAVLEHVDDLHGAYSAMRRWLNPGGVMSHQIDYRCHRKADTWNGHWTYSDHAWGIVVGRRPYLLNRAPHSRHLHLLDQAGFEVVSCRAIRSPSVLRRRQLAQRFRNLSEDDLTTSGAHLLAVRATGAV